MVGCCTPCCAERGLANQMQMFTKPKYPHWSLYIMGSGVVVAAGSATYSFVEKNYVAGGLVLYVALMIIFGGAVIYCMQPRRTVEDNVNILADKNIELKDTQAQIQTDVDHLAKTHIEVASTVTFLKAENHDLALRLEVAEQDLKQNVEALKQAQTEIAKFQPLAHIFEDLLTHADKTICRLNKGQEQIRASTDSIKKSERILKSSTHDLQEKLNDLKGGNLLLSGQTDRLTALADKFNGSLAMLKVNFEQIKEENIKLDAMRQGGEALEEALKKSEEAFTSKRNQLIHDLQQLESDKNAIIEKLVIRCEELVEENETLKVNQSLK